jgi:hypothetical protein
MSPYKLGLFLALSLTTTGVVPASAGINGTEYLLRLEAIRRSAAPTPSTQWHNSRPQVRPDAAKRPNPHRFYGGPRSLH